MLLRIEADVEELLRRARTRAHCWMLLVILTPVLSG